MLKEIPKAQGHRTDMATSSLQDDEVKPKTETVSELGFNRNQVSQFQRMADHEEQVQEAVLDAEAKIGELTAQIPKGAGRPKEKIDNAVENKSCRHRCRTQNQNHPREESRPKRECRGFPCPRYY